MYRCIITTFIGTMLSGAITAQSVFYSISESQTRHHSNSGKCHYPMNEAVDDDIEAECSLDSDKTERWTDSYKSPNPSINKNKGKERVLRMYEGESHALTMANVLHVMEEENISNRLFVLAQSLLETGYYKSKACKTYHNLFGLTNPKTGRLYRFERWEDSVIAYREFVQYKYKGGSYLAFLKKMGYAEDPRYISKVIHISRQINKDLFNIVD